MKSKNKGFSLLELLAVIFIISLLFGVSFYYVNNVVNHSRDRVDSLSESSIEKSASLYVQEYSDKIVWDDNKTCVSIDDLVKAGYLKDKQVENLDSSIKFVNLFKNNAVISGKVSMDCSGRKSVPVPTSKEYCNQLEYSGEEQILVNIPNNHVSFVDENSENSKVDANSYSVRVKLDDGYIWHDGTNEIKTITCTIKKAFPTLTLSSFGESDKEVGGTTNVSVESPDINGKLAVRSSNTNYVVGSIESSYISRGGSTTLTVKHLATNANVLKYLYVTLTPTGDFAKNYYTTTVVYTIGTVKLQAVDAPTSDLCANGLVDYDGKELYLLKENLSVTGYNFVSGTRASGVGYHTVTVSLKYGYVWADGKSEVEKFNKRSFVCYIKKNKITPKLIITSIEGVEDKSHFKGSVSNGGSGTLAVSKSVTFTLESDVKGTISPINLDNNISIISFSDSEDKKTHYVTVKGDKISGSKFSTIYFTFSPFNSDDYNGAGTHYELKIMSGVTIFLNRKGNSYNGPYEHSGMAVGLYQGTSKKHSAIVTSGRSVTFFGVSNGTYDIYMGQDSHHKTSLVKLGDGRTVTVNNSSASYTVNYLDLTVKRDSGVTKTKVNGTEINNNGIITVLQGWHSTLSADINGKYRFNKWSVESPTDGNNRFGNIDSSTPRLESTEQNDVTLMVYAPGTITASSIQTKFDVTIHLNHNNSSTPYDNSGMVVALYQGITKKYSATVTKGSVATLTNVSKGTYDIYMGLDSNHPTQLAKLGSNRFIVVENNDVSYSVIYYDLTIKRGTGITNTMVNGTGVANNGLVTVLQGWHSTLGANTNSSYRFNKWTVNSPSDGNNRFGNIDDYTPKLESTEQNDVTLMVYSPGTITASAVKKTQFDATINLRLNSTSSQPFLNSGMKVALYQDGESKYFTTVTEGSAAIFTNISNGTYDIYMGMDSFHPKLLVKSNKTITIKNSDASQTVDYYSLTVKMDNGIDTVKVNGTAFFQNTTLIVAQGWNTKLGVIPIVGHQFNKWNAQSVGDHVLFSGGKNTTTTPDPSTMVWSVGTVSASSKVDTSTHTTTSLKTIKITYHGNGAKVITDNGKNCVDDGLNHLKCNGTIVFGSYGINSNVGTINPTDYFDSTRTTDGKKLSTVNGANWCVSTNLFACFSGNINAKTLAEYAKCDFTKTECTIVLCANWNDNASIFINHSVDSSNVYYQILSFKGQEDSNYNIQEVHLGYIPNDAVSFVDMIHYPNRGSYNYFDYVNRETRLNNLIAMYSNTPDYIHYNGESSLCGTNNVSIGSWGFVCSISKDRLFKSVKNAVTYDNAAICVQLYSGKHYCKIISRNATPLTFYNIPYNNYVYDS